MTAIFTTWFREYLYTTGTGIAGVDVKVALFREAPSFSSDDVRYMDVVTVADLLVFPGWLEATADGYDDLDPLALGVREVPIVPATTPARDNNYLMITKYPFTGMDPAEVKAAAFYVDGSAGGETDPIILITDTPFGGDKVIVSGDDGITANPDVALSGTEKRWILSWSDPPAGAALVTPIEGPLALSKGAPVFEPSHTQHVWLYPQRANLLANPSFEKPGTDFWSSNGTMDRIPYPAPGGGAWAGQFTLIPIPAQTWPGSSAAVAVTATSGTWEVAPLPFTDVLMEPFDNFTTNGWSLVNGGGGNPTIVAGRTGTAARFTAGSEAFYTMAAPVRSEYLTFGFAYKLTAFAGQGTILQLQGGGHTHTRLRVESGGSLGYTADEGTVYLGSSAAGVITANTWYYIELQTRLHSTLGSYTCRVNGTVVFTGTNKDTRNSAGSSVYETLRFTEPYGFTGESNYIDDLYLDTGPGAAFKGDTSVPTPPPTLPTTTGLQLWLDADDASTFTYSSGTIVSQWGDKSGGNRHATQATVGNQPSRSGTQNGRATVVFDGTNDKLETAAPVTTATDNVTVFVACRRTGGSDGNYSPVVFTASSGFGLGIRAQGTTIGVLQGGVAWHMTSTPDPAAPGVYSLRRSSGTWTLRLNGTNTSLSTSFTPSAAAQPTTIAHDGFGGPIYEVLIYNVALSDADRTAVETYLKDKWGTP